MKSVGHLPEKGRLGVLEDVLSFEANVPDRRSFLAGGRAGSQDSGGGEGNYAHSRAERGTAAPHRRHTRMPGMNLR
jgi:hypothetical protein